MCKHFPQWDSPQKCAHKPYVSRQFPHEYASVYSFGNENKMHISCSSNRLEKDKIDMYPCVLLVDISSNLRKILWCSKDKFIPTK